jgi:hypothetical protein
MDAVDALCAGFSPQMNRHLLSDALHKSHGRVPKYDDPSVPDDIHKHLSLVDTARRVLYYTGKELVDTFRVATCSNISENIPILLNDATLAARGLKVLEPRLEAAVAKRYVTTRVCILNECAQRQCELQTSQLPTARLTAKCALLVANVFSVETGIKHIATMKPKATYAIISCGKRPFEKAIGRVGANMVFTLKGRAFNVQTTPIEEWVEPARRNLVPVASSLA